MQNKITIKNAIEIAKMRQAGKIGAQVLKSIILNIKPGVTTKELDRLAEDLILKAGATPSFKNFKNYPASICVSINSEVVHGIPKNTIIENGDIVSIDLGVYYQGYHADMARTIAVGKVDEKTKKLIEITKKSLEKGIKVIKAGVNLGDVQSKIQKTIEKAGFSVIRDLAGHGIGKNLQEAPSIPNFGTQGKGIVLKEGMTLAIEPMVAMRDWHIKILNDGWTVATRAGSLAAHFEDTILVTKNGSEILTK